MERSTQSRSYTYGGIGLIDPHGDLAEEILHWVPPSWAGLLLEEFAHAIMNFSDEQFVSDVVALLYAGVKVIDGKYHPVVEFDSKS